MTTVRQVNSALKVRGTDCKLYRGKGYYFISGPAADACYQQGIYIYSLHDVSVDWMLKQIDHLLQNQ